MEGVAAAIGRPYGTETIDRRSADYAFCVTLYNEPCWQLARTIRSVLDSLASARVPEGGRPVATICIVADGEGAMDASTRSWVEQTGLRREPPDYADPRFSIYASHCSVKLLREVFPGVSRNWRESLHDARFLFVVKSFNAGKLDSHELFFRSICPALAPELCFQLDAGTEIATDAVSRLAGNMARDQRLAGVAPTILVPRPPDRLNLRLLWQYYDFLTQRAISWPFEVVTGHLSVLPGQFCAFRWASLTHSNKATRSPLDCYLRGTKRQHAVEELMYLAEDRVIGMELVLAENKATRLTFDPGIRSYTDACASWLELARQRRRWNNSTLACRLWLLAQSPAFLSRPDRSLLTKAWFCATVLGIILLVALDVSLPAIVICGLLSVTRLVCAAVAAHQGERLVITSATVFLIAAAALVRARALDLRSVSGLCAAAGEIGAAIIVAVCTVASLGVAPPALMALLILPAVATNVALYAVCLTVRERITRQYITYSLAAPFVSLGLWAYSLLHLNDVSWGTKGLTESRLDALREDLDLIRIAALAIWVVANVCLISFGVSQPGLTWSGVSPVFEGACLAFGIVACAGAVRSVNYVLARLAWRAKGRRHDTLVDQKMSPKRQRLKVD